MLSIKYGLRNRAKENNLGWQKFVNVNKNRQQLINREIKENSKLSLTKSHYKEYSYWIIFQPSRENYRQ